MDLNILTIDKYENITYIRDELSLSKGNGKNIILNEIDLDIFNKIMIQ